MHAENMTILVKRDLRVVDFSAFMRGGDKIFGPVFDPFDGTIQLHRRPGHEHFLLVEHHDLRTKSPTDDRRDDWNLSLRKPKYARQSISNHNGRLCCIPDG